MTEKSPARAFRGQGSRTSGGAGNRTRVLCRLIRASPCAVDYVSTRPDRSRRQVRSDRPRHCGIPNQFPCPELEVSLLADAGIRNGGASGPTAFSLASGGEGERALVVRLGAYRFAMTLAVVSRLHRHASPESTNKVETVHPRRVLPCLPRTA